MKTVILCPRRDAKLQPHQVNLLSYRECGILLDGGKDADVTLSDQLKRCCTPACVLTNYVCVIAFVHCVLRFR